MRSLTRAACVVLGLAVVGILAAAVVYLWAFAEVATLILFILSRAA